MTARVQALADRVQHALDRCAADRIAARFGCEASPHPALAGRVEVTAPGLVLIGTPDEVGAELARLEADGPRTV